MGCRGRERAVGDDALTVVTMLAAPLAAARRQAYPGGHRASGDPAAAPAGCANGSATRSHFGRVACMVIYATRATVGELRAGLDLASRRCVLPEWWTPRAAAGGVPAPIRRDACVRMHRLVARRARASREDAVSSSSTWTGSSRRGSCSAARRCCCFLGLPVAFTFLAVNLVGAASVDGRRAGAGAALRATPCASVASFALTPIPLFVLMGEVLFHTGLAVKVIDGIERLDARGARPAGGRRSGRGHGVLGDLGIDHRDDWRCSAA